MVKQRLYINIQTYEYFKRRCARNKILKSYVENNEHHIILTLWTLLKPTERALFKRLSRSSFKKRDLTEIAPKSHRNNKKDPKRLKESYYSDESMDEDTSSRDLGINNLVDSDYESIVTVSSEINCEDVQEEKEDKIVKETFPEVEGYYPELAGSINIQKLRESNQPLVRHLNETAPLSTKENIANYQSKSALLFNIPSDEESTGSIEYLNSFIPPEETTSEDIDLSSEESYNFEKFRTDVLKAPEKTPKYTLFTGLDVVVRPKKKLNSVFKDLISYEKTEDNSTVDVMPEIRLLPKYDYFFEDLRNLDLVHLKNEIFYLKRGLKVPMTSKYKSIKSLLKRVDLSFSVFLKRKMVEILMINDKYLSFWDATALYKDFLQLFSVCDYEYFYEFYYKRESI